MGWVVFFNFLKFLFGLAQVISDDWNWHWTMTTCLSLVGWEAASEWAWRNGRGEGRREGHGRWTGSGGCTSSCCNSIGSTGTKIKYSQF